MNTHVAKEFCRQGQNSLSNPKIPLKVAPAAGDVNISDESISFYVKEAIVSLTFGLFLCLLAYIMAVGLH